LANHKRNPRPLIIIPSGHRQPLCAPLGVQKSLMVDWRFCFALPQGLFIAYREFLQR
jgi:hypothetical protein